MSSMTNSWDWESFDVLMSAASQMAHKPKRAKTDDGPASSQSRPSASSPAAEQAALSEGPLHARRGKYGRKSGRDVRSARGGQADTIRESRQGDLASAGEELPDELVGMHLELTVKPQWVMLQLTQQTTPEQPRRRVKALPDAWLGVHLTDAPMERIGDAERCCPTPKLSQGGQGQLCIRQSDLSGMQDGVYRFALYSRHWCVARTMTFRFSRNRFAKDLQTAAVES